MLEGCSCDCRYGYVSGNISSYGTYRPCNIALAAHLRTRHHARHGHQTRLQTCSAVSTDVEGSTDKDQILTAVDDFLQTVPSGRALENLERADAAWRRLCDADTMPHAEVIREVRQPAPATPDDLTFDVVVLGGTLGIFLATTLALQGKRVAVVERGRLLGRDQEWNISRRDMKVFLEQGLLSQAQLDELLVSEFNPVRMGFQGIAEITTRDVLNCGVPPRALLDAMKQRFLGAGGTLLEGAAFQEASVHPERVHVRLALQAGGAGPSLAGGAGGEGQRMEVSTRQSHSSNADTLALGCRLLVDGMGSFSPIAAQARRGRKPDSVVMLVGSCATGLPPCTSADLLYSFTPIDRRRRLQYFWEVFPARDGLTTYTFAYCDPAKGRPSLREMFSDYLELLPAYRGVPDLRGVRCLRPFHGFVPNWHDSPLAPVTARLLHIGDAAGNRSALSFAGFGSMVRHLERLTEGVAFALDTNQLSRGSLALLQPGNPAISMTAAMQFSMGTRSNQVLDGADFNDNIINEYLGSSFGIMQRYGEEVFRPFMEDYLQAGTLSRIVGGQIVNEPGKLAGMTLFMRSAKAGQMFAGSFLGIVWYDFLFRLAGAVAPAHELLLKPFPGLLFRWRCLVDAFKYGSANDYEKPASM